VFRKRNLAPGEKKESNPFEMVKEGKKQRDRGGKHQSTISLSDPLIVRGGERVKDQKYVRGKKIRTAKPRGREGKRIRC